MDDGQKPERRPTLFTRMFGAARYVMTIASLAVFVGATVLLVVGTVGRKAQGSVLRLLPLSPQSAYFCFNKANTTHPTVDRRSEIHSERQV